MAILHAFRCGIPSKKRFVGVDINDWFRSPSERQKFPMIANSTVWPKNVVPLITHCGTNELNGRPRRSTAQFPELCTLKSAISGLTLSDRPPDYYSVLGQFVRKATGIGAHPNLPVVVGVDVGEAKKGFHLVALRDATVVGKLKTPEPREAVEWCLSVGAKMVGVDAPCGWCTDDSRGRREAEEMLALQGYSSFPTPRRELALTNPINAWMLNGERLYTALRTEFPLFDGKVPNGRFCFETYPYVASCGLAGRRLEAKNKRRDRRDIIRSAGISDQLLTNGDYLDAAICAMAACSVAIDYATACGNPEEGFIVAPCYH